MTEQIDRHRTFVAVGYSYPMLTREREQQLATNWREHGDKQALREIVHCHIKLVIAQAAKRSGYGLPQEDLIQEGNVGLMQAAARFDPKREIRFSTYAKWWVNAAMDDYIVRTTSLVKMGTTAAQKTLFFGLNKAKNRIRAYESGDLTPEHVEKIAQILCVSQHDVVEMNQRLRPEQSLHTHLPDKIGQETLVEYIDTLVDPGPCVEDALAARETHNLRLRALRQALDSLPPRWLDIIMRRRLREEPVLLGEIADEQGVSRQNIQQIEQKALKKLREATRANLQQIVAEKAHNAEGELSAI